MDIATSLFIVGFVIILGLIAQFMFKRLRIPDVLILIIFGALLSHFGLAGSVKAGGDQITFLVIFSLIYVVFYGALPIRLKAIFSTMKYAFFSSLLNLIAITSLIGIISYLIGFNWVLALSLGALFCVLDGSIINSLLETIKVGKKAEAQIQIESAIIDILVIVGILSIINFSAMNFNQILQSLINYLFLSFGIGLFVAIIWAFALKHIGHYSSAPIATMAILVMVYAFAEYVTANGVITVFSFSIVLGNMTLLSKLFYEEQKEGIAVLSVSTKSFFRDISFLIRTFLFVYLGILVDFTQWGWLLIGLAFFLIAYLLRSFIGKLIVNKRLRKKEIYFLDAMCAKGLTPTVILAVIQGDAFFANIVVGGIFFSVLITSILILLIEKNKFTSGANIIFKIVKKIKKHHTHSRKK